MNSSRRRHVASRAHASLRRKKFTFIEPIRAHKAVSFGLAASLCFLAFFLLMGLMAIITEANKNALLYASLAGMSICVATILGAIPGVFIKALTQKSEDALLGSSAGMMLAASVYSLILPALESSRHMLHFPFSASLTVVFGMTLGVFLMLGMEIFTPHQHLISGRFGISNQRVNRMLLFTFAIAIHNLPEGMAVGAGFSTADIQVGLPITLAIGLQDLPEGLAVVLALRRAGFNTLSALGIAALTGFLEFIGAIFGLTVSSGLPLAYPLGLSFSAGAMLFVVFHEVIPETHRFGHQTASTLGLMMGFALMMVLDTMFTL